MNLCGSDERGSANWRMSELPVRWERRTEPPAVAPPQTRFGVDRPENKKNGKQILSMPCYKKT